jgi:hypothetical protein
MSIKRAKHAVPGYVFGTPQPLADSPSRTPPPPRWLGTQQSVDADLLRRAYNEHDCTESPFTVQRYEADEADTEDHWRLWVWDNHSTVIVFRLMLGDVEIQPGDISGELAAMLLTKQWPIDPCPCEKCPLWEPCSGPTEFQLQNIEVGEFEPASDLGWRFAMTTIHKIRHEVERAVRDLQTKLSRISEQGRVQ